MSIVSKNITTDGSSNIFSADYKVLSENHIEVYLDGTLVSKSDYDVINNAAVFDAAPPQGIQLTIRQGTTPDDLLVSTTNIDTVAGNISNINSVEDNLADINTVASNISSLNTNATNIDDIKTVATIGDGLTSLVNNLSDITTVANIYPQVQTTAAIANDITTVAANTLGLQQIATNLPEILNADDNATIATTQAGIATTKATEALASATTANSERLLAEEAEAAASNNASSASTSASNASTSESNALVYRNQAETFATNASNSASSASTSESNALSSENNALASENKANKWAEEDENVEVETGKYSAKHWAAKAAIASQGSADNISYDNTASGLTATNVKDGLDELASEKADKINTYTKTEVDTKTTNISHSGKSSLLKGTFSLSNTVIEAGFGTKLYTGNGSTQSINAGVDLATQWGDTANESYGGLVWYKDRDASLWNGLNDTVRGVSKFISSNATNGEQTGFGVSSFNNNGFTMPSDSTSGHNISGHNYVSWIFQTTHRISGTTNHGKNYTCHYNPITGFTIVKYEGSGIAGHEIPHHLGRKLGFATVKGLTNAYNWIAQYDTLGQLELNTTDAKSTLTGYIDDFNEDNCMLGGSAVNTNASGNSYILYGWANSYYDDAGELNGNYEVGIYQGTGASGNKITTRGKPAWLMVKRLDSADNWFIIDCLRNDFDNYLMANLSNAEVASTILHSVEDGFIIDGTGTGVNASGGQYLYMVVYDNDNASGKSKFDMVSETSNLQLTNLVASFTNGVGTNGVVNTIKNLGSFTVAPTGGFDL